MQQQISISVLYFQEMLEICNCKICNRMELKLLRGCNIRVSTFNSVCAVSELCVVRRDSGRLSVDLRRFVDSC